MYLGKNQEIIIMISYLETRKWKKTLGTYWTKEIRIKIREIKQIENSKNSFKK